MSPTDERDRLRELIAAMGQHVGGVRLEIRAPRNAEDPFVLIATHPGGLEGEKRIIRMLALEMIALGFPPPEVEKAYDLRDVPGDGEAP